LYFVGAKKKIMEKSITINKTVLEYRARNKKILPEEFRDAFLDYCYKNFTKEQLASLPIDKISNCKSDSELSKHYPMIQFKTHILQREFEIVTIGKMQELETEWRKTFLKKPEFIINNKVITGSIRFLEKYNWKPSIGKFRLYKIEKWIPFNGQHICDDNKFDEILIKNIQSILSNLKIITDTKLEVHVIESKMTGSRQIICNKHWVTFDIIFTTNINLPSFIGLGQFASLGYGKISSVHLI